MSILAGILTMIGVGMAISMLLEAPAKRVEPEHIKRAPYQGESGLEANEDIL